MNYTTVIGVDRRHLCHLELVWPTWMKHKPSLLFNPMLVFYDRDQVTQNEIHNLISDHRSVIYVPWPPKGTTPYLRDSESRFGDAQRYRMLSGFIHATASYVSTPYWLKLDLDTVATGNDNWVDEKWFEVEPAIIASPWGYTKPKEQMLRLDEWVVKNERVRNYFKFTEPLNLVPKEDSDLVRHERIISWCGLFHSGFTRIVSLICNDVCGLGKLPVPSQDGLHWYFAKRGGFPIIRTQMKKFGWEHCGSIRSIEDCVRKVMNVQ